MTGFHRRLAAFVLALFVAGAPEVMAACNLACISPPTNGVSQAPDEHSCAHSSTENNPAVSLTAMHVCGHVAALPQCEKPTLRTTTSLAVVVTLGAAVNQPEAASLATAPLRSSPPGQLSSPQPLRI